MSRVRRCVLALGILLPGLISAAPEEQPPAAPVAAEAAGPDQPTAEYPARRARNVDLDAPVTDSLLGEYELEAERGIEAVTEAAHEHAIKNVGDANRAVLQAAQNPPFLMLGSEVPAGTATRLAWQPGESFAGIAVATPVLVVHGVESGPVLCLTAAVHGDELNGIEMVRRVLYEISPAQLRGTVVGVPIVNLLGFKRGSRYLPDRRDLNRHFPGNPEGSSASRIAYSFFNQIVRHCTVLADLHTGSFYRTNLPQLRADLRREDVVMLTKSFTSTAVVHSPGAEGSLRRAAAEIGIPAVTLEAGEPLRLQSDEVDTGVAGIFALIDQLGMYRKLRVWGNPAQVHYQSRWVRADSGGILFGKVELGQQVRRGVLLGTVTDPITNVRADILSPYDGRVIGMAVDQVVLPGFAAFHIGIQTSADDLYEPPAPTASQPAQPLPAPEDEDVPEDDGGAPDRLEDS